MDAHSNNGLVILRRAQVERETGLSRSTIYQRIKNKTFPAPIQLGPRAVGWRRGDIDAFLRDPAGYQVEAAAQQRNSKGIVRVPGRYRIKPVEGDTNA